MLGASPGGDVIYCVRRRRHAGERRIEPTLGLAGPSGTAPFRLHTPRHVRGADGARAAAALPRVTVRRACAERRSRGGSGAACPLSAGPSPETAFLLLITQGPSPGTERRVPWAHRADPREARLLLLERWHRRTAISGGPGSHGGGPVVTETQRKLGRRLTLRRRLRTSEQGRGENLVQIWVHARSESSLFGLQMTKD